MAITRTFALGFPASGGAGLGSGTGPGDMTTPTFSSAGNTHLAVFVKHEGANTTATLSDNKSTVWQAALTKQSNGVADSWGQWFYGKIGSPGTGHTVSLTLGAARDFRQINVYLINSDLGEIAVEDQKTSTGVGPGGPTTITAGTLTTTVATVSLMCVAEYVPGTYTPGGATGSPSVAWTEDFDQNSPNYSYGQSRADTAGTTIIATCTGSAQFHDWGACAVSFKEISSTTVAYTRYSLSITNVTPSSPTSDLAGVVTGAGDLIVAILSWADNSAAQVQFPPTNSGSALTWNEIIVTNFTAGNDDTKHCAWWAIVPDSTTRTVTFNHTSVDISRRLHALVHRSTHASDPVPAGKVFSGSNGSGVSQAITPTASGSALWMIAADWAASDTYGAGANCTLEDSVNDPLQATFAIIRPTTQPRTDALAFTLAETDTGSNTAWIAFEVQAVASTSTIDVQPTNQVAAVGATAVFSITASNATTYQWQDDRTGIFTNVSGGSGDTTASYTTATLTQDMSRRYRCVVDSTLFSQPAQLFIGHPLAWAR